MKRPDGSPKVFGPTFDRAALAALNRRAVISRRVAEEAWSVLSGLQEALRTAGVVLAVLRIVELYPASWWLIWGLMLAPFLVNLGILAGALVWSRLVKSAGSA